MSQDLQCTKEDAQAAGFILCNADGGGFGNGTATFERYCAAGNGLAGTYDNSSVTPLMVNPYIHSGEPPPDAIAC